MAPLLKRMTCLLVCLCAAGSATAQNEITIIDDPASLPCIAHYECWEEGYCGEQTIHLVAMYPQNVTLDQPIQNIGSYMCRVVLPPGVNMVDVQFPAGMTNVATWPDLVVGGASIPVVNEAAVLASIVVEVPEASADLLFVRLEPVTALAEGDPLAFSLTDADGGEGDRIQPANPYSCYNPLGDYDMPILYFAEYYRTSLVWGTCVVGDQQESWGAMKALYR